MKAPPPSTGAYTIIERLGIMSAPAVEPAKTRHDSANATGTIVGSTALYISMAGVNVIPPSAVHVPSRAVRVVGLVVMSVLIFK